MFLSTMKFGENPKEFLYDSEHDHFSMANGETHIILDFAEAQNWRDSLSKALMRREILLETKTSVKETEVF